MLKLKFESFVIKTGGAVCVKRKCYDKSSLLYCLKLQCLTEILVLWVDKCEGPEGSGALRVNELESSLCDEVGVGWRWSHTHSVWPEILQASFTLKGFLVLRDWEHLVPSSLFFSPFSLLSIWSRPTHSVCVYSSLHFFPLLALLLLGLPSSLNLHHFSLLPAAPLWAWVNKRNEGDRYMDGSRGKREEK